jgi:ParB-like chromosome segregation protein Spo0J
MVVMDILSCLQGILDQVDIKKIRPPKYALRDDLVSLDELMVSIKEKGLL